MGSIGGSEPTDQAERSVSLGAALMQLAPRMARIVLSSGWMRSIAVLLAVLVIATLQYVQPQVFANWNERLTSATWGLSDRTATERRVVVIDIDEKSVQELGSWPWPRDRVAQLLGALDQQGVSLKVVDILFDGTQPQDAQLTQALGHGAPSVVAQLFSLQPDLKINVGAPVGGIPGATIWPAGITQMCPEVAVKAYGHMSPSASVVGQALSVGHITPAISDDGAVRKVPALICHDQKVYPALVVSALAAATGAKPILQRDQGLLQTQWLLEVGGLRLPLDQHGNLMVSYKMPREGFISLSASDVLAGRVPTGLLSGAWALVGSTALGAGDAVPTPQGAAVGGIEVHAQLMSAALDERTPHVPAWAALWPWACGLLSVIAVFLALRFSSKAVAVTLPLAALFSSGIIFLAHAYLLLAHAQALPWGTPALFAGLLALFVLSAEMLRVKLEREKLFVNLMSYLPATAARKVAFQAPSAQVVAQKHVATVMLVDIRNFAAYCKDRSPEEVATVLHLFYGLVERLVSAHGGVVEQMVGDSVMAVWNGSHPCPDHAVKALGVAESIWREGVAQLPRVASRKTPPLDIGIGIESGDVLVGSLGPSHRRVHTVLGETVTIAKRLQELTADLSSPILLGSEVVRLAADTRPQSVGNFVLEGLSEAYKVYRMPVSYDASHLQLVYSIDRDKPMFG
jgi:adenylate cyclase